MTDSQSVDYLIVGAGPAGLQLAYFLDREGRNYLVLEGAERAGTFFEKFPRHEKLLSINKRYTGYTDPDPKLRYDWNSLITDDDFSFRDYSADYFPNARDLARYLQDFAERYRLNIRYGARVQSTTACEGSDGARYEVVDQQGRAMKTKVLIIATGVWDPYVPDIPGIEHGENYVDFSVDPEDFAGQRVLILGKSNSAFETANHLTAHTQTTHVCSPNSLKLAWKSHYVGNVRAVNNDFLDTYFLKGQNAVLDATVDRIERRGDELVVDVTFSHAQGQRAQFSYDRVLVCTGFRWDASLFAPECQPDRTPCGRLPAMTAAWESTNLPHVYYCGTLMQTLDKHKTMSNVIHGFRFNVRSLLNILAERYEGVAWPAERLPLDPETLADKVIDRVSTSPELMLQPGFLADVLVVEETTASYKRAFSLPYIESGALLNCPDYYVITMEYGHTSDDMMSVNRMPEAAKANQDVYLHPRIRRFSHGQWVGEHHIAESLENEWRVDKHPGERPLIRAMGFLDQQDSTRFQQTHRDLLAAFFRRQLATAPAAVRRGSAPALV